MKALTICQPYAELIARRIKRVENRTWYTLYRGQLLIHAGKSREWLTGDNYGIPLKEMPFGAIVATANLVDCARIEDIELGRFSRKYPWLADHEHTEGPYCWILEDVRPLRTPVPYTGKQGLFTVPDGLVEVSA